MHMKEPNDILAYRKSVEKLRIHIFLNGLDTDFEQVCGEILRMDPSLDLEHTYAYVRREANRRTLLAGDPTTPDSVAMLARRPTPSTRRPGSSAAPSTSAPSNRSYEVSNKSSGSSGPPRTRIHYGGTGHTKSQCYDLIGYPDWWDPTKASTKRNSKSSSAVSTSAAISESSPSEAMALHISSPPGKSLDNSVSIGSCTWIIDSGSTDHMSFDMASISTLNSSDTHAVSTANGTLASLIGEGSLSLPNNLNLDSVLVVPSLNFKLLSVSQITTALNCVVIFWPDSCVFKDIKTRRTIGCGTRRGKLYNLDLAPFSSSTLAKSFSMYFQEAATASQGEHSRNLQFFDPQVEHISHESHEIAGPVSAAPAPDEPAPSIVSPPPDDYTPYAEATSVVSELVDDLLELPPCNPDGQAAPPVPQHQLFPLDGSSPPPEVTPEPPLRTLPNRTT
ncbi:hypothetical protein MRB53_026923 [Persea americana]|uniref:Uncharacterized protein n=1 Tax=Persea americana TaxID=3435 RepID=A0ACC2LKG8_PERAE|nr:hypothetical protein MRB53_026923 [Persea americana]